MPACDDDDDDDDGSLDVVMYVQVNRCSEQI